MIRTIVISLAATAVALIPAIGGPSCAALDIQDLADTESACGGRAVDQTVAPDKFVTTTDLPDDARAHS